MPPPSIQQIQQHMIDEMSLICDHRHLLIDHILRLGTELEPLSDNEKQQAHLVEGCLSNVWIVAMQQQNCLHLKADSNALFTKGMLALVLRLFSGQPLQAIQEAKLFFIQQLRLDRLISEQRQQGLNAIIKHIRQIALSKCHEKGRP